MLNEMLSAGAEKFESIENLHTQRFGYIYTMLILIFVFMLFVSLFLSKLAFIVQITFVLLDLFIFIGICYYFYKLVTLFKANHNKSYYKIKK